jgi:enoyl-CoA hydratase
LDDQERRKMVGKVVLYEVKDKVAYIVLNRPEKRNVLNRASCAELREAWLSLDKDPEVRVGIITGAGNSFCAGQDLGAELDSTAVDSVIPNNGIYIAKPLIAAINGWAAGSGLAICANCDIRVASEEARFVFPEAKVGTSKGGIELLNVMNTTTAVELMLTGEPIDAQRAYQAGFLNRVVPAESLMKEAERFADILKHNAPLTMKMLKAYIFEHKKTLMQSWNMMYDMYIRPQEESTDVMEGITAFKEKRAPQFRGE